MLKNMVSYCYIPSEHLEAQDKKDQFLDRSSNRTNLIQELHAIHEGDLVDKASGLRNLGFSFKKGFKSKTETERNAAILDVIKYLESASEHAAYFSKISLYLE